MLLLWVREVGNADPSLFSHVDAADAALPVSDGQEYIHTIGSHLFLCLPTLNDLSFSPLEAGAVNLGSSIPRAGVAGH